MQGGRNSHQWDTALQDALGQFLDKQWHAVGAVDDLIEHSSGNALPPAIWATRALRSRRSRRLRVSIVTCGWPVQSGWNSGRNVTITNTGRLGARSIVRSSNSREVGSIQCASS